MNTHEEQKGKSTADKGFFHIINRVFNRVGTA